MLSTVLLSARHQATEPVGTCTQTGGLAMPPAPVAAPIPTLYVRPLVCSGSEPSFQEGTISVPASLVPKPEGCIGGARKPLVCASALLPYSARKRKPMAMHVIPFVMP